MLSGIIVTRIEVIKVNRREQFCISIKHEDFGNHDLHYIYTWVRLIREGSYTHVFEDITDKEEKGEVAIGSAAGEAPIHATT